MRKIIFILVLLSQQIISYAQPNDGRVIAGPTISYQNQQTNDFNATGYPNGYKQVLNNLTLTIQPGYFISDNFCMGVTASYIDNKENTLNPPKQFISEGKTYQYGLFARQYFKISEKFYFTNSFVITLETGTNNVTYSSFAPAPVSDSTASLGMKGYFFSYAPGVIYFITPHIGIKTNISGMSYHHTTVTTTAGYGTGNSYTEGIFTILSPLTSFNVGVDFFFGKAGEK
jgi:hypothetical protein